MVISPQTRSEIMVIGSITIVCPGRSTLQYLRLNVYNLRASEPLGPEFVIGGHITLDGNRQTIYVGDVGLPSAATRLHSELTEGLNVPRVVTAWW